MFEERNKHEVGANVWGSEMGAYSPASLCQIVEGQGSRAYFSVDSRKATSKCDSSLGIALLC